MRDFQFGKRRKALSDLETDFNVNGMVGLLGDKVVRMHKLWVYI